MTINEFRKKIDQYFNECEENGVFPDEAGMVLHLGVSRETLEMWLESDSPRGYAKAVRDARLRRESVLVRGIYASEKSTTGKIFLSRQGSAGALSDKNGGSEQSGEVSVEVKIVGIEDCFE